MEKVEIVELPMQHGFIEPGKDPKRYRVNVTPAGWQKAFSFILLTTASKAYIGAPITLKNLKLNSDFFSKEVLKEKWQKR